MDRGYRRPYIPSVMESRKQLNVAYMNAFGTSARPTGWQINPPSSIRAVAETHYAAAFNQQQREYGTATVCVAVILSSVARGFTLIPALYSP